jgi:hypothetical protein
MPQELLNIFLVTLIRLKATKLGIKELHILKDRLKIAPNSEEYVEKFKRGGFFIKSSKEEITVRSPNPTDPFGIAISALSAISN